MAREPFQYAVIRVVPRIEREEFVNVGVILFCRTRGYLAARIELDEGRLGRSRPTRPARSFATTSRRSRAVAAGEPDAGPIARLAQSERFHWLVAPSSTVIQTSPVHSGLCDDPEETLAALMVKLVAAPAA